MEHFDDLQEHKASVQYDGGQPMWHVVVLLLGASVVLFFLGALVCWTRGITPTMYVVLKKTSFFSTSNLCSTGTTC